MFSKLRPPQEETPPNRRMTAPSAAAATAAAVGSKNVEGYKVMILLFVVSVFQLWFSRSQVNLASNTLQLSMDEELEISVVTYEKLQQQQQLATSRREIVEDDDSSIPSRLFVPWKNWTDAPLPCVLVPQRIAFSPKVQRMSSAEGLLFIKIEKAASTTAAGVAARISHKMARRMTDNVTQVCKTRFSHLWASKNKSERIIRDPDKSFTFTFIKEPTKRILSMFYFFFVARAAPNNKKEPTDENVKKAMHDFANAQLHAVHLSRTAVGVKSKPNKADMQILVEEALNDLNFIGIVERLDESIVLLQLMLDLDTSDVLFASSQKQTGGYVSNELGRRKSCSPVPPYNISKATKDYIQTQDWQDRIYWDNLLYKAVHKSMDRTIEAIGKEKFQTALEKYRTAMKFVKENCNVVSSCGPTGEFIPRKDRDRCYWIDDVGCGYECLDKHFG